MKTKILSLTICALLSVLCVSASAQQPIKIPRIGYISGTGDASNQGPYVEALRQGLKDLGYVEGTNFIIEFRGAAGKIEAVPHLVAELLQLKVDVLILPIVSAIRAAMQATKSIPIVIVTQVDPVASGLVDSLAHPGGNITGIATLQRDLSGKRLELVAELVPRLSRIAILWEADESVSAIGFKNYESAARALKIKLQSLEVRGANPDLDGAFGAAAKGGSRAVIAITNNSLFINSKRIIDLPIKNRLPSMHEGSAWV